MATNEDLLREIIETRTLLTEHIRSEEPVLAEAKILLDTHGNSELVRKRIDFINVMIEREQDRKALRQAIITKTTVLVLLAVLAFVIGAVWLEVKEMATTWHKSIPK